MGHANRPRLHYALGLDAQSRCLCFSSAQRWESNTNTNGVAECYTYSYGNSYAYTDSHAYSNSYAYTHEHTECHAYRHLPGNLYDSYYHWHHNRGRHRYRQPLRRLHYAGHSTLPSKRIRQSADFSGVCWVERHAAICGRAPTQAVLLHVVHPGGPDSRP